MSNLLDNCIVLGASNGIRMKHLNQKNWPKKFVRPALSQPELASE